MGINGYKFSLRAGVITILSIKQMHELIFFQHFSHFV